MGASVYTTLKDHNSTSNIAVKTKLCISGQEPTAGKILNSFVTREYRKLRTRHCPKLKEEELN